MNILFRESSYTCIGDIKQKRRSTLQHHENNQLLFKLKQNQLKFKWSELEHFIKNNMIEMIIIRKIYDDEFRKGLYRYKIEPIFKKNKKPEYIFDFNFEDSLYRHNKTIIKNTYRKFNTVEEIIHNLDVKVIVK